MKEQIIGRRVNKKEDERERERHVGDIEPRRQVRGKQMGDGRGEQTGNTNRIASHRPSLFEARNAMRCDWTNQEAFWRLDVWIVFGLLCPRCILRPITPLTLLLFSGLVIFGIQVFHTIWNMEYARVKSTKVRFDARTVLVVHHPLIKALARNSEPRILVRVVDDGLRF